MFNASRFAAILAAVLFSAIAAQSAAASGSCAVTFRLTSAVTLSSLLMTSDYSAANGEFDGEFIAVDCTDLSETTTPIFNDNEDAELLGLTFFAPPPGGLQGPTDLAVCSFTPNAAVPVPGDFVSNIQVAGGLDGLPIAGVEVIVSDISCGGSGTTTTSTTTTTMPTQLCGDTNGDGRITATDALFILGAAVGLQSCALCVCDMDGSGSSTASDALQALNVAVGQQIDAACPAC